MSREPSSAANIAAQFRPLGADHSDAPISAPTPKPATAKRVTKVRVEGARKPPRKRSYQSTNPFTTWAIRGAEAGWITLAETKSTEPIQLNGRTYLLAMRGHLPPAPEGSL